MANIGIFYGSTTGNTESAAERLAEIFEVDEAVNVDSCDVEDLLEHDIIILGSSTWGSGDLQDDWEEFLPQFDNIDLNGKTVAMFCFGDQEGYGDTFLDSLKTIYDKVIERGAKVVGAWPTDGYDFEESTAIVDGKFVGLALDNDNQDDLTDERIDAWVEQIKGELSL